MARSSGWTARCAWPLADRPLADRPPADVFPEHLLTTTSPAATRLADHTVTWVPDWPLDLVRSLAVHRRGASDPTMRVAEGGVWRTTTTPDGPATVRISRESTTVRIEAWGPGAERAGTAVPGWLGAEDRPEEFTPGNTHPLVTELHRTHPDLRLGRTGRAWDAIVPAVLEQKVTTVEAFRVFRELCCLAGEPAPGPAPDGMRVVPSARRLLEVTDWEWHRCGLDGARRRALRAIAGVAHRMEPGQDCDSAELQRRMRTVPGIGVWTAAEVVQRALGCPDTVSVGDYHLKNTVGFALTGRRTTDDEEMVALLEPWRGHRQRVVRLILAGGPRRPRRGPRFAPTDHRRV